MWCNRQYETPVLKRSALNLYYLDVQNWRNWTFLRSQSITDGQAAAITIDSFQPEFVFLGRGQPHLSFCFPFSISCRETFCAPFIGPDSEYTTRPANQREQNGLQNRKLISLAPPNDNDLFCSLLFMHTTIKRGELSMVGGCFCQIPFSKQND